MKAIFNNEILELKNLTHVDTNRGFRYGDGIFETIAVISGQPRFLESHIERLSKGIKALKIHADHLIKLPLIKSHISRLQTENNLLQSAVVRIHLWREAEGLFEPEGNSASLLITMKAASFEKRKVMPKAGFSEKCINYPWIASTFKTMSSLKYVIAGIEKKEKQLDEIIILDQHGFVSEALSSNIFWQRRGEYFTPPISTGCVEGIMRKWLFSALAAAGDSVQEKKIGIDELLKAESIFTSNAAGITHIQRIGNQTFKIDERIQKMYEMICGTDC